MVIRNILPVLNVSNGLTTPLTMHLERNQGRERNAIWAMGETVRRSSKSEKEVSADSPLPSSPTRDVGTSLCRDGSSRRESGIFKVSVFD